MYNNVNDFNSVLANYLGMRFSEFFDKLSEVSEITETAENGSGQQRKSKSRYIFRDNTEYTFGSLAIGGFVKVVENTYDYTACIYMPGCVKDDIVVKLKDAVLNISAIAVQKEGVKPFQYSFDIIFADADYNTLTASYNDNLLTIKVRKLSEKKVQVRKIIIK